MSPATPTFRCFVRSTFSDMKEERNPLDRNVSRRWSSCAKSAVPARGGRVVPDGGLPPGPDHRRPREHLELVLGEGTQVFRRAPANGKLSIEPHCVLRGRVSSDTAVSLASDVVFERIGGDTVVKRAEQPASVVAPEVELADGATVYGQINAMRGVRTY